MKLRSIEKSLVSDAITAEQLEKINIYSRRELKADEVFVFSIILCDNEIDRDLERFPDESLVKLEELYLGKTGVFDHLPKAQNQSARIFETEVVCEERENSLGQPYRCLKAWAYMVRCDKNADLILEIDAGIKKEVSVGCAVEKILCSVCGADQKNIVCEHKKGREYGGEICHHLLVNPTDAYEWSFVAVPAQKKAGVVKGFADTGEDYEDENTGFESLEKLFCQKGCVRLAAADLLRLRAEYGGILELAKDGEKYRDNLRREVVKLALLAEPLLDCDVIEEAARMMDTRQLAVFAKSYGRLAAESIPLAPQLCRTTTEEKKDNDRQFRI